jgi:hypothetical protein
MRKVHLMEGRIVTRSAIWIAAAIMATVLQAPAALADETSQILRGYEIIKEIFPKRTKLNFAGTDWALVGLGSYLVNSTGCNDCHTHPNWAVNHNPYMGQPKQINTAAYLSGGRQFLKSDGSVLVTSANITPDMMTGRPAGLTLREFLYALQTGHDPKDGDILQVMPWPLYQWKTDRELKAMYEYLRIIPPLPDPIPGP